MQKITTICRVLNTVFLLSLLVVSLLILRDMPIPFPTQAEFTQSKKDRKLRNQFEGRLPVVSVTGMVDVSDILTDVTISGSVGIDGPVTIDDVKPIHVEIQR